jgi:hypothetical protein
MAPFLRRQGFPAPARLGSILAIDDEPDVVEMLSVYLSGSGYRVFGAEHDGDGSILAVVGVALPWHYPRANCNAINLRPRFLTVRS